jgi:hypothetical protein
VLAPDKEAEEHARQDHAGEGDFTTALDEETLHRRDLEGLEAALGGLGAHDQHQAAPMREEELLASLERRLSELRAECGL